MPATPPFPFRTAPDAVVPAAPAPVITREPVWSISYPNGCGSGYAIVQLDCTPFFDREPDVLPDKPGGGWSYAGFLEYWDLGIAPYNPTTSPTLWSGTGITNWNVLVDGVAITSFGLGLTDGIEGPFGFEVSPTYDVPFADWTAAHTWQLQGVYLDRPAYSEFYFDAASIGIVGFGPSTSPLDPNTPYIRNGVTFGCDERSPSFFPSALWGDYGYYDPWVIAHHNVSDVLGPKDRLGNYLSLTGPWGSDVLHQAKASRGAVCTTAGEESGDIYAESLVDFCAQTNYPAISYTYTTPPVTLPACVAAAAGTPVFDVTRAHKIHH